MRVKFVVSLLVSFILSGAFAQGKYDKIDKIARAKIPSKYTYSPKGIANYLVQFAKTEEEKARILFVYTTAVIEYDLKRSGTQVTPFWTINNGVGVCQHYAELYTALCGHVGLKCAYVTGYARNDRGYRPFQRAKGKPHAWNVVRINGKWYIVDATWADGGNSVIRLSKDIRRKQMHFDETYWMADPEEMILTHWPRNARWQLLDGVVKLRQFKRNNYAIKNVKKRVSPYNYVDSINYYMKLPKLDLEMAEAKDIYRNDSHGLKATKNLVYMHLNRAGDIVKKKKPTSTDYQKALAILKQTKQYTHGSPIKYIRFFGMRSKVAKYRFFCRMSI